MDEKGAPIKLSLTLVNWFTLKIQYQPDYSIALAGLIASLGLTLLFLFIKIQLAIFPLIGNFIPLYFLVIKRRMTCILNKQIERGDYIQSGVLWLRIDEKQDDFAFSEIKSLQMIRHMREYLDTFQLALLLNNGKRVYLSSYNLDFGECQDFAQKIHDFLELDLPIKAID